MAGRLPGRVVLTGALAAGLMSAMSGVATASPPPSYTGDYALTALRSEEGVAFVTGFVPPQEDAAPTLDVFVLAHYHCTSDEPLDVSIESLVSATISGTTTLMCVWEPDPEDPQEAPGPETVIGVAAADISWSGTGEVQQIIYNGSTDHCVGRSLLRDADVTGEVTVEIAELEVRQVFSAPSDSVLGFDRTICPPRGL